MEPIMGFNKLDPEALEATLSYFETNPAPCQDDTEWQAMLDDVVTEDDWMQPLDNDLVEVPKDHVHTRFRCTWNQCLVSMTSEEQLSEHLVKHSESLLEQWAPASKCMWPGCTSKAIFNNESKYRAHLKNIHVEPVACEVAGCTYKKPFRSRTELERHKQAVHTTDRPFVCPFSACDDRRFARKDKWLQHIRETVHDGDAFCPYIHCDKSRQFSQFAGFQTRKEISSHFNHQHSIVVETCYEKLYKCALGLCALYPVSDGWGESNLRGHLEKHHSISKMLWHSTSDGIYQAARRATKEGDIYTLRPEHLEDLGKDKWGDDQPKIEWQECTVCLAVQQSQQAPQMSDQIFLNTQDDNSMQYLPQQQLVPQGYQYFMPAGSSNLPNGNAYFGF